MKDKLKQYLMDFLSDVYCDTCARREAEDCDDCHRKSMRWRLSEETADTMVKEITNIFREATNAD